MTSQREREIGRRIRLRRERCDLTQEALAPAMGLPSRQTLGQIEHGNRRIRPQELAGAAEALNVDISFFTDPFAATGEAAFSFRTTPSMVWDALADFETKAERWLVAYRELAESDFTVPSLSLRSTSSYESAQKAADQIRRELRLGDVPAERLPRSVSEVGILVLHVDAVSGVSGAAATMEGLHAILINRKEVQGRRNFDLAHELFHVLTWATMQPEHIDARSRKRVEQLADNFASALLMPDQAVRQRWGQLPEALGLPARVRALATRFQVSGAAMKWRLHALGLVRKSELPDDVDVAVADDAPKPLPFSLDFVSRLHTAVETGRLSLRKAADIVDVGLAGFEKLCRLYGRSLSYEV